MKHSSLSNELRRFIQTITSIPHLEVMLLIQHDSIQVWSLGVVAQRIYIDQSQAAAIVKDLCVAGICKAVASSTEEFIYAPALPELKQLIDQLAVYYPKNLIEVTNMIHSKAAGGQRVQMFADAFKINKDK
jgi:hypothetical protein